MIFVLDDLEVNLYCILFFLKNFLDYEKIDVRVQILKRHKLSLPPKKRLSEVFRSKFDLRVTRKLSNILGRNKNVSLIFLVGNT